MEYWYASFCKLFVCPYKIKPVVVVCQCCQINASVKFSVLFFPHIWNIKKYKTFSSHFDGLIQIVQGHSKQISPPNITFGHYWMYKLHFIGHVFYKRVRKKEKDFYQYHTDF